MAARQPLDNCSSIETDVVVDELAGACSAVDCRSRCIQAKTGRFNAREAASGQRPLLPGTGPAPPAPSPLDACFHAASPTSPPPRPPCAVVVAAPAAPSAGTTRLLTCRRVTIADAATCDSDCRARLPVDASSIPARARAAAPRPDNAAGRMRCACSALI
eukprot:239752-Chlamydomonas_euryale.AAC.3